MSAAAKVGLLMLAALAILAFFIIKVEDIRVGAKAPLQHVTAELPSAAGIDSKTPVRIAGVKVGSVERVELEGGKALVHLGLEPEVTLHQGARAQVATLGLLGDSYIAIDPGPAGAPRLPAGVVISGRPTASFDQLMDSASSIGDDIKALSSALRNAIASPGTEKKIPEIIDNLQALSGDLRTIVAANRADVNATIGNFRDFSQTLKTELPKLSDKLASVADRIDQMIAENRGNLADSLGNIKDLSARLKTSADNLNDITTKISKGEGSIGKLVNDGQTVDKLNATLDSVRTGADTLEETVGRIKRYALDVNMHTESLPRISDTRTVVGVDLHTTDKRFYRFELADSPQGLDQTTTDTITTTFPDGHKETLQREKLQVTDQRTLNAQVGYRMGDYTLRAGLFESKGGVGVDRSFLDDRLRFTLEAYNWGREVKPPLVRFEGRYYVTKNVYAFGGWNDPLLSQQSSALIGAGVTWRDEDLKYLVPGAAGAIK